MEDQSSDKLNETFSGNSRSNAFSSLQRNPDSHHKDLISTSKFDVQLIASEIENLKLNNYINNDDNDSLLADTSSFQIKNSYQQNLSSNKQGGNGCQSSGLSIQQHISQLDNVEPSLRQDSSTNYQGDFDLMKQQLNSVQILYKKSAQKHIEQHQQDYNEEEGDEVQSNKDADDNGGGGVFNDKRLESRDGYINENTNKEQNQKLFDQHKGTFSFQCQQYHHNATFNGNQKVKESNGGNSFFANNNDKQQFHQGNSSSSNQSLRLQDENDQLRKENERLRKQLIALKTDLVTKYEEIRTNNEQMFQSFEEKSKSMLKKQKQKYDVKILKLNDKLKELETQVKLKKENFQDRNQQLYQIVLKLEKEKQALLEKNIQLIQGRLIIRKTDPVQAEVQYNQDQSRYQYNQPSTISSCKNGNGSRLRGYTIDNCVRRSWQRSSTQGNESREVQEEIRQKAEKIILEKKLQELQNQLIDQSEQNSQLRVQLSDISHSRVISEAKKLNQQRSKQSNKCQQQLHIEDSEVHSQYLHQSDQTEDDGDGGRNAIDDDQSLLELKDKYNSRNQMNSKQNEQKEDEAGQMILQNQLIIEIQQNQKKPNVSLLANQEPCKVKEKPEVSSSGIRGKTIKQETIATTENDIEASTMDNFYKNTKESISQQQQNYSDNSENRSLLSQDDNEYCQPKLEKGQSLDRNKIRRGRDANNTSIQKYYKTIDSEPLAKKDLRQQEKRHQVSGKTPSKYEKISKLLNMLEPQKSSAHKPRSKSKEHQPQQQKCKTNKSLSRSKDKENISFISNLGTKQSHIKATLVKKNAANINHSHDIQFDTHNRSSTYTKSVIKGGGISDNNQPKKKGKQQLQNRFPIYSKVRSLKNNN